MRVYFQLGILIFTHMMSMSIRLIYAVIADPVGEEFVLSFTDLGLFVGMYNILFALAQIPLGIALDRYSARNIYLIGLVIIILGAVVSALAPSQHKYLLFLGQALIGLGCAPVLMVTFLFIRNCFPSQYFVPIASLVMLISSLGHILASTPLATFLQSYDWRMVYVLITVVISIVLVVAMVFGNLPHGEENRAVQVTIWEHIVQTFKMFLDYRIIALLCVGFTTFPIKMSIRAMWIGPYLSDVFGADMESIGTSILYLSIALLLGFAVISFIDKRISWYHVTLYGALMAGITLLVSPLFFGNNMAIDVGVICFVVFLLCSSMLVFVFAQSLFPPEYVGRALTIVNFSAFTGVAYWQVSSGFLLDTVTNVFNTSDKFAYNTMFVYMGVTLIISGFLFSIFFKKIKT